MHTTKHTLEARNKMSATKQGKHYSPTTEFKKGHTTWNKGKTGTHSEETRRQMGFVVAFVVVQHQVGAQNTSDVSGNTTATAWPGSNIWDYAGVFDVCYGEVL